jgi:hypothetical protein
MKIRVIVLASLLLVLAGTAANAHTAANVQHNATVTCCDPPPACGMFLCPPDGN